MCHFNPEEWMHAFVAELPSLKETISPPEVKFSIIFLNALKYHVSIVQCNGLLDFVISLFKTKTSLFQFVYSMCAYNLSLVFFRVVEDMVQYVSTKNYELNAFFHKDFSQGCVVIGQGGMAVN